jgi:hypothetical protein
MTNILIGFVIGLIVGWNFLPQPKFIKDLFDKLFAYIKSGGNNGKVE